MTREVVRIVPATTTASDIAFGGGFVWAAGAEHTLARFDPDAPLTPRTFTVPGVQNPLLADAPGHVSASGRTVWATTKGAVWRIEPAPRRRFEVVERGCCGLIAIGFGSVWVVGDFGVDRVALRSGAVQTHIKLPFHGSSVAVGADGVWVADVRTDRLWRIDPADEHARRVESGRRASVCSRGRRGVRVGQRAPRGPSHGLTPIPLGLSARSRSAAHPAASRSGWEWSGSLSTNRRGRTSLPRPGRVILAPMKRGRSAFVLLAATTPFLMAAGASPAIHRAVSSAVVLLGLAAGTAGPTTSSSPTCRWRRAAHAVSRRWPRSSTSSPTSLQGGSLSVGYQSCDDDTANAAGRFGNFASNAKAYAATRGVVGVIDVELPIVHGSRAARSSAARQADP